MNTLIPQDYTYYIAAGRALAAIHYHRAATQKAVENIRDFVMLCGADRALGGTYVMGLHFSGTLPKGWIKNATAPHMAVPDMRTLRGQNLADCMAKLKRPTQSDFAKLIGVYAAALPDGIDAPIILPQWPDYEARAESWVIKCPTHSLNLHNKMLAECQRLNFADYLALPPAPAFNLIAAWDNA